MLIHVFVERTSEFSYVVSIIATSDRHERAPGYRAEVRNRSVRVRNLPAGTQEGLLQQVLEKHAQVKRVEVFQDLNEAEVELENAAVSLIGFSLPSFPLTPVACPPGSRKATSSA